MDAPTRSGEELNDKSIEDPSLSKPAEHNTTGDGTATGRPAASTDVNHRLSRVVEKNTKAMEKQSKNIEILIKRMLEITEANKKQEKQLEKREVGETDPQPMPLSFSQQQMLLNQVERMEMGSPSRFAASSQYGHSWPYNGGWDRTPYPGGYLPYGQPPYMLVAFQPPYNMSEPMRSFLFLAPFFPQSTAQLEAKIPLQSAQYGRI
ncbi:hypothetical protein CRG98_040907 [Punica granatum]|nr:hypothetical protein CRG98_040907 [Punica granatum]